MDPRFLKLITDYQKRVAEAVAALERAGFSRPRSDAEWAGAEGPKRGESLSGYRFFKHGYGCGVQGPGFTLDFDFGESGQIDGFEVSRLKAFAANRLEDYGLQSPAEVDALFAEARDAGELAFSGYILFYLATN